MLPNSPMPEEVPWVHSPNTGVICHQTTTAVLAFGTKRGKAKQTVFPHLVG